MNKIFKIIITSLIAIVICYFVYFLYCILICNHSTDWEAYKQYMWIFKDSIKNDIDTESCYSFVKKRDIYNNFHYKRINNIIVWEFKDLNIIDLKNISINKNVILEDVKVRSGEILNKDADLEITVKYGFTLNNYINVNIDRYSKIGKRFEGPNYIGFYGTINEMSFSNKKGKHQIIFNYTQGPTQTIFLLYKGGKSFYVIIINSDKPLDESIINILNLK